MKKNKIIATFLFLASLFIGFTSANALTSLPDSVVSDEYKILEYIDNFRVVKKSADNNKYSLYCINMEKTYAEGITFSKQSIVNPGFLYILNNRPNTGDPDKDFYITQMAVWYYEDYLNQNNNNLETIVKKYIVAHKDTEEVSKKIIELLNGAQTYKQKVGVLAITEKDNVTFKEVDGYFVSSPINIVTENMVGNLKYSLTNAPIDSKVVKTKEGIKVKIPADKIKKGYQIQFSLNVEGNYLKSEAYYYYYNSDYQKILLGEPLEKEITITDSVNMIVRNYEDSHKVEISKTDITQSKEVPGATLVVKDNSGKVIDTWVSTDKPNLLVLKSGEYTLNETIAPKGYRLSSTTIYFRVSDNGEITIKNDKGNYVTVNKVVMINELLDVVSFAKKDSKTDEYVSGAKLVIKDKKGNVVSEFVSSNTVYQLALDAGEYTLSEISAPTGYILSDEIKTFEILQDGTLRVKNNNGEFIDSALVVFYNTKEDIVEIPVPATGKNATLLIISGISLLIGGIACARKTIKEC